VTTSQTTTGIELRRDLDWSQHSFLMFVLDEMANEYDRRHDDVIRLTLGKSELAPPEPVTRAMSEALLAPDKYSLVFPAGLPELRERIAREHRERFGAPVDAENVIVNNGTSGLFRNLLHLMAGPGDEVLLPMPYYPLYPFCAWLAGAQVRFYRIDPVSLAVDLDSLRDNLTDRTKIVVLNSPGNPLGNLMEAADLRRIDAIVDGRALILSDEIYANAAFEGQPWSAWSEDPLTSPVVVTNGFSKAYRMYARRVGYAIVPDDLVRPLTVVQHHTLLTTDPVPQFGALAALDHPEAVTELVASYRLRRDYTVGRFAGVPGVDAIPSRGGFYFTLECGRFMGQEGIDDSLDLATRIMRQTHVATVPGSDFGLPTALRLSYTSARYEEGIDRLAGFFRAPPDRGWS
jgi:aspartate/methionine/tyrosine aminotransferase